jgi:hypothetical protein
MPYYSLEKIIAAAKAGQIIYGGRNVNRDIANLGYTLNEVADCIMQLQPEHHQKIWVNDNNTIVFDVYIIEFSPRRDGQIDSIYMKLRLMDNGQINVGLGSFHLS